MRDLTRSDCHSEKSESSLSLSQSTELLVPLYSTIPQGAYFVLINTEKLQIPEDFKTHDAIAHRAKDWRAAWFIAQT